MLWKRMYLLLFNRVTDALEALGRGERDKAATILIRAQQDCEALYLDGGDDAGPR